MRKNRADQRAQVMSDKAKIVVALAVFVVLALFPVWYAVGSSGDSSAPDLVLPPDGACVEPKEYMIGNHMNLLNDWRDAVVRDGQKEYTSSSDKKYVMSLTGTCMSCHTSRETFCRRCHEYANVEPGCWDCHLEPKGN